jgi:hypothetical protein
MQAGSAKQMPNTSYFAVVISMRAPAQCCCCHFPLLQVWWHKGFSAAVDVVRYSPDGTRLAAAGHDQVVEVYDITAAGLRRYERMLTLQTHLLKNYGIWFTTV